MKIFSCFLSCWSCLCQLPAEEMQDRSEPNGEMTQNVVTRIDGLREKALWFVQTNSTELPASGIKLQAIQFVATSDCVEKGHEVIILNEIFNRLKDPAFLMNPDQYLADWEEKRGFTREFRVPEDNARIFFDQADWSLLKNSQEQVILDIQTNPDLDTATQQEVLNDIFERLADPAFVANQEKYFDDWSKARGLTREFRIPEDISRTFFHQIIYSTLSTK